MLERPIGSAWTRSFFLVRRATVALLLCGGAVRAQPERITFAEAMQRALARNPSVLVAAQEISRVHGLMREVRAAALPTLSANGAYTRIDSDRTSGATLLQPRNSWNGNLMVAVPLVAPQRWVQWEHAAEQVDVARLSAEDVRRQVAITAARTYVSVLTQHRFVDANQQAADNARDHYEDAKARFTAGSGSRLDVARAGQELATSQSQLHTALTALVRAQEALGTIAGADVPLDSTEDMQFPPLPAPPEAMREAEDRRADIQAQRKRLEALDITTLAYHAGATNDLDVVDAQRRARDAANAVAIAEDAARQARIDLLAASGRFP